MKKILSLLSMLMITVMAFATDYTDQLKYEIGIGSNYYPVENAKGTLSITQYANGNYQVTAKNCDFSSNPDVGSTVGNLGNLVCDGLSGTTDANGVTTIDVTECTAGLDGSSWIDMSSTKLLVKFKGDKAYATFTGKYRMSVFPYQWRTVSYTFGTDEGFEGGGSTGGGETGGEVAAPFEKVDFVGDGTNFDWKIPVNWDTQKIVMSINPSTCTGGCEDIIGLGQVATAWKNTLHLYRKSDGTLQGYFQVPGGSNNNTNPFDETNPIKVEVSKAKGFVVNDVVKIPASEMSALFALSTVNMGTGEGANDKSRATYNYVKVVDKDWTEVPPVTVKAEVPFTGVTLSGSNGVTGTADVTFKEMSDETVQMTFNGGGYGISATNLTKGTDAKGRTTYTGEAVSDVMSTVTYTVNAVVYSEGTTQKLYMTMVDKENTTFTVGEDPDYVAPVTYKNTLKVVRGTDTKTYEDAEVSVLAKGEGMYEVTLPKFSDMDNVPGELGPITFQAKGVEENGKVVLTATDQEFTLTNTGWKNDVVKVSMKGEIESEMLKATFNVNHSSMSGYNYTLYYGVEAPEVVTEVSNKTYKSNLRIADQTSEDENAYLFQTDEATVNIIKYSDKTYKITLKQITLNSKTSDLVFTGKAVESEVDPGEGGAVVTEGTMVQATADAETQNFLGGAVNAQFMWQDVSDTEIRMSFVLEGKTLSLGGEFNYEKKDPDQPKDDYAVNFDKTAKSTHSSRALNSFSLQQTGKDKQTESVYASKAAYEDHTSKVFTVEAGSELTASFDYTGEWMHSFVYIDFDNDGQFSYKEGQWDQTGTDLVAFSFYSLDSNPKNDASGYNSVGDELTGDARNTYAAPSFKAPAKAGEYRIRFKFDWNCILPGGSSSILSDGGGVWDATLKVVEPVVDGISSINAEVANGEAQLFTIDGVKLNKLQKGLNIVRTADGKVKKVLVK